MATDPSFDPKKAISAGLRAVEQGRPGEAMQIADETLRRAGKYPGAFFLKAYALRSTGDLAEAITMARKAEKAGGRDPLTLNLLALLYKESGKSELARRAWQDVLAKEPRALDAILGLARLDRDLGRFDASHAGFERALALAPGHADTLASYADARLKGGDLDQAVSLAEQALATEPGHPLALSVWASQALRHDTPEKVADRLTAGLALGKGRPDQRAPAIGWLAEALERSGKAEDAYAHYSDANRILYDALAPSWADADYSLSHIRTVLSALQAQSGTRLSAIEDKAAPAPVFLTGFPRSGTTLAAQMLAGHDRVVLSDEAENARALLDAAGRTAGSWQDYLAMTPARRTGLRRAYWKAARAEGPLTDGRVLVDKLPVNAAMVAALGATFPDARFIVMVRDPRDAVASAFKQRFEPNASTVHLRSLDAAADYYDAVHRALLEAQRVLPDLHVRIQSYEKLAADPESEGRAMAAFAGLDWQAGMLDVQARAREARIQTPSALQLLEPIEARSAGQWKTFEAHFTDALETLRPWTQKWGTDA